MQYKKEITLNSALHSKRLKKLCLIRHFIVLVAVVLLEKGFCYPRGRRHHNLVPRVAQPLLLLSRTFYERSNSGYAMKPKKKKTVKRQTDTKMQWNTLQVSLFYSFHLRKSKV